MISFLNSTSSSEGFINISEGFINSSEGFINSTARYIWSSFYIFVLISSFLGDTTILIASIKYRAFKLQKTVVTIIQHIAVCDLLTSLLLITPRTASLLAGDWMFGSWLCQLQPYIRHLNSVNACLICFMIVTKLLTLMYPFRAKTMEGRRVHMGCGLIWGLVTIVPVLQGIRDSRCNYTVTFDSSYLGCVYVLTNLSVERPNGTFYLIFLMILNILVITTTTLLVFRAYKVAKTGRMSLKWQGVTTTILTAVVYFISGLPYVVYMIVARSFPGVTDNVLLRKSVEGGFTLNIISNFYIYCLTVNSFRCFVLSCITSLLKPLSNRGNKELNNVELRERKVHPAQETSA